MAEIPESQIQSIVESVLKSLGGAVPAVSSAARASAASAPQAAAKATATAIPGQDGVFEKIEDAIEASHEAFRKLSQRTLEDRGKFIQLIRDVTVHHAEESSRRTVEETGIGRADHKIEKHRSAARLTPGIEDLEQKAWTGDRGLTVVEMAPFGVIGAVTPSTHPVPTMVSNAIGMISAGNTVVFQPHPSSKRVVAWMLQNINRAIAAAGGPANLMTTVVEPTMDTAKTLFTHPRVRLLVVTGGPGVVKSAMNSGKKAICAGPGNPPVVVDETADLKKAARDVFAGAVFDNNVLCIAEKEVFVVDSVADEFKRQLAACGSLELTRFQIDELARKAFTNITDVENYDHPKLSRDLVGRGADVLARSIGLSIGADVQLLFGETSRKHVFVQAEQMMPFLPIVRCRNFDECLECALEAEHGFGHTAMIHSKDVDHMSRFAKAMNTTIVVKNGPSMAGDGLGGEGYVSFSIASPTGEGITSTRTFTRQRRCTLVDYFRIV